MYPYDSDPSQAEEGNGANEPRVDLADKLKFITMALEPITPLPYILPSPLYPTSEHAS